MERIAERLAVRYIDFGTGIVECSAVAAQLAAGRQPVLVPAAAAAAAAAAVTADAEFGAYRVSLSLRLTRV